MSKNTVADIIKRYVREDRIESIPQKVHRKITCLTKLIRDKLIRKIKVNLGLSATKLTSELYEETSKKIYPNTVRRALKESDYNGRVARKKPFINEANRKKRLIFAKEFISKEQIWWDVIFVDESKFNIF